MTTAQVAAAVAAAVALLVVAVVSFTEAWSDDPPELLSATASLLAQHKTPRFLTAFSHFCVFPRPSPCRAMNARLPLECSHESDVQTYFLWSLQPAADDCLATFASISDAEHRRAPSATHAFSAEENLLFLMHDPVSLTITDAQTLPAVNI